MKLPITLLASALLTSLNTAADKRKEMEALLLAEMRRLDDPYRLWDQPQETAEVRAPAPKLPKKKKKSAK